jgi:vacuolar-type H+-ATPase subunit I/STV1
VINKPSYLALEEELSKIKSQHKALKFSFNKQTEYHKTRIDSLNNTTRKKKDSLEKLNEAEQLANFGTWEFDTTKDTIWWSEQTYRIFDLTPKEILVS